MADIDFDSEDIENLVNSFSNVLNRLDGISVNSLSSCSYINNQCKDTISSIEKMQKQARKYIEKNTTPIMDILEEMKLIDGMGEGVFDFSDIMLLMQMKKKGEKIVRADADFFKKCGYDVKNGVVKIKGIDGTYKYDINDRKLTNPDGTWLHVNYYIPQKYDDLSNLNTITCLAGQGEPDVDSTKGQNSFHIDSLGTDSIIVCPSKKNQKDNGISLGSASYSFMADRVINSTKFANLFANQKKGCQNVIGGCSSGGGSALKIASKAGDLYDTVFCINYAPLIEGKNDKGKGKNGNDNNRLSIDDAKNLNGKNLILLSSSSDPNIEGNKYSYMYTGVNLLIDYCPDAQIYVGTNLRGSTFKDINGNNYHYLGDDFWKNYAKDSYSGHGSYHGMFRDLINSGILGKNNHNM